MGYEERITRCSNAYFCSSPKSYCDSCTSFNEVKTPREFRSGLTSGYVSPKAMVKISEMKDGRFSAQYINENDKPLHGIEQYGKTVFEAEINLFALIVRVKKEQLRLKVAVTVT